jgi:hypothetical protein
MALKPDREEFTYDINWFCNTVAERGGVATASTYASGGYPGDANAVVVYAANPSGKRPIGILFNDFVNIDQTKYHLNFYKEEAQVGAKAVLVTRGTVTTNMVTGTIAGGDLAYAGPSGLITNVQATGVAPAIGFFETTADEDGYYRVRVNL